MPAFRDSTQRALGGRIVAATAAGLESEVALPPAANVQRTTGDANDIVEFKSDRSHETDVVIVGGGLGGKCVVMPKLCMVAVTVILSKCSE